MAGLIPNLWSQGVGADFLKRVAAPMVGGMLISTVLTLAVIPSIYSLWKERRRPSVIGGIWTAHWLYWLAPVSGMMIGMRLYDPLRASDGSRVGPVGTEGPILEFPPLR